MTPDHAAPRTLPERAIASGHVLPPLGEIFREHADFVWRTLHRLGVREADLPDALQDVFVVVQRRAASFDGTARATTWLFSIAARVAANQRRAARHHREELAGTMPEVIDPLAAPDAGTHLAELRSALRKALAELPDEQRVTFVMFEIEELSCEQIATELGIPIGTVYSRIHAAKKRLIQSLPPGVRGGLLT